jgi:DNA-binding XRE family transcriptional regulator
MLCNAEINLLEYNLLWNQRYTSDCLFLLIQKYVSDLLPLFAIFPYLYSKIRNIFPMKIDDMGKAIKFRREFLNLRQEDLAEMSGITSRTIHLIESGTGNPSIETLEKLATILGMELLLQVKKPE